MSIYLAQMDTDLAHNHLFHENALNLAPALFHKFQMLPTHIYSMHTQKVRYLTKSTPLRSLTIILKLQDNLI